MTGYLKMTKLDFFTMKAQFIVYLSLVIIVMMFEFMGSSVVLLCITGAWFVALTSSNIFAIQEKNNLDRLYGSVSVRLKDIVLGRYVFMLLNYLISFIVIVLLHSGFALFQNNSLELTGIALGFSLSFFMFSIITGIQMPMFFKMGYTKAKFWSMIPFIVVVAVMVNIPSLSSALSGGTELMPYNHIILVGVSILASFLIQFLSYKISRIAYRKRR